MPADVQVDATLPAFISRFLPLHQEGNESVGRCPFCESAEESLKISSVWRTYCCNAHELNGNDAPGFYACWTNSTRDEAIAKLGNGAGLPDAQPIAQVPLRKLPFWGCHQLEKRPGVAVWIHELSGAVLVWRELVPERVHLGLITGRAFEELGIVAPPRRCVLVPEANVTSRVKMQQLASALYRAGHAQVMCLDLGLDPEYETRALPPPGLTAEEVLKWAKARSKPYPHPNAAPQEIAQKAPEESVGDPEPPPHEQAS